MGILLTDRRSPSDAGYFRIGRISLDIPPESIVINRVPNNQELTTLRSSNAYFRKSGHQRIDILFTWKALVLDSDNYAQWEQIRELIAYTKVAPFVEIENEHVRHQIMSEELGFGIDDRMAVAIRSLKVETVPDLRDALQVTLHLSWFNYLPYSKAFAYRGQNNISVSAQNSPLFGSYIKSWIDKNLGPDWMDVEEDEFRLTWRRYQCVEFSSDIKQGEGSSVPKQDHIPTSTAPPKTNQEKDFVPKGDLFNKLAFYSEKHGVPIEVSSAVMARESSGDRLAVSPKGASGLMQLMPDTARGLGVTDIFDVDQNIEAGVRYLAQLNRKYKRWDHTLMAYNWGPGNVDSWIVSKKGMKGQPVPAETNKYLAHILPQIRNPRSVSAPEPEPVTRTEAPRIINIAAAVESAKDSPRNQRRDNLAPELRTHYFENNWTEDHHTETNYFFYQDQNIDLNTGPFSGNWSEDTPATVPMQISVVFTNTLSQIPLSGHVYPTMQHVGAAGAMISVSFSSIGVREPGRPELVFPDQVLLNDMMSKLDSQFHALRGRWRAASSVHRMQSAKIRNRLLNMLGIETVMPQQLTEETVPDASDMVQVTLLMSHYRNVYEELGGYLVKDPSIEIMKTVDSLVTGNSWNLLSNRDSDQFRNLRQFREMANRRDLKLLTSAMDKGWDPPQVAMPGVSGRNPVFEGYAETLLNQRGLSPAMIQIADRLKKGTFSYTDYLHLMHASDSTVPFKDALSDAVVRRIQAAGSGDPFDQMRPLALQYQFTNNPDWVEETMRLQTRPEFREAVQVASRSKGPSGLSENRSHHCYPDLELPGMGVDPDHYFADYSQTVREQLSSNIGVLAKEYESGVTSVTLAHLGKEQASDQAAGVNMQIAGDSAELRHNYASSLLRKMNPPKISMSRAFPTFKLMLIEEDNDGPFFAFDDFYTYNSVLNIEVIRKRNEPDTAVITLTNFSNILQHKFYNNTTLGRQERENRKFEEDRIEAAVDPSTGRPMPTVNENAERPSSTYYENRLGINMTNDRSLPHWYYALRTGGKIQVRMGYSNDPDNLFPVFNGLIAEIQEGEIITLICQGYMVELMNEVSPEVLDEEHGTNFTFHGTKHGQADDIIRQLLNGPYAKHFGSRKIARGRVSILSSPSYEPLKEVATNFARSSLALPGTYGILNYLNLTTRVNRAGENVWINNYLVPSGVQGSGIKETVTQRLVTRPWHLMSSTPFSFSGTTYWIPKDQRLSPWQVMKDVSRYWPEYNLLVKNYGFPYQADATLVFADPNDCYYARPEYPNEDSLSRLDPANQPVFEDWWKSQGKDLTNVILQNLAGRGLQDTHMFFDTTKNKGRHSRLDIFRYGAGNREAKIREVLESIRTVDDFHLLLRSLERTALARRGSFDPNHGELSTGGRDEVFGGVLNSIQILNGIVNDWITSGLKLRKQWDEIQQQIQALTKSYIFYCQQYNRPDRPWVAGDRMLPVQKWHVVTNDQIIANEITLNDQVYNAVRVDTFGMGGTENVLKANNSIPDEEIRLLDATSNVIAPKSNLKGSAGWRLQSQSYLREELGRMYSGDLVILGHPEIEPDDVVHITDEVRRMYGPVEVDSVIHSLDQKNGMITIVRPRAMVLVNQATGAGTLYAMNRFFFGGGAGAAFEGFRQGFTEAPKDAKVAMGVLGGGAALSSVATARVGKFALRGSASFAKAAALRFAPKVASRAAASTVGAFIPGVNVIVGTYATYELAHGIVSLAMSDGDMNPIIVVPLMRHNRPWVGGMARWKIQNMAQSWVDRFVRVYDEEFTTMVEGFQSAMEESRFRITPDSNNP